MGKLMPKEDRVGAGWGQGLREEYRFCPNCGTLWPIRPVKARPAPVFTPEESLAKDPPPLSLETSPWEDGEEWVSETLLSE
jgi:hypothetical protein